MKAVSGQAVANAQGIAEVDISPPSGYEWSIGHIGIFNTSTTNSFCSLFLNQRFICGSNIGNADAADGTPVPVRTGDTVRFVWQKCSVGAICTVQMLVQEGIIGQGVLQ